MDYTQLRTALTPDEGTITLSPGTLTPNVDGLLTRCNGGNPLRVYGAVPGPGDGENETVVVAGTIDFLNVPGLPVELRATVDAAGNAQLAVTCTLLGPAPGPTDWKFSRSFPSLPVMVNWNGTFGDPTTLPLDDLPLFDARYLLVTQPGTDAVLGVPLEAGINFAARMRPTGALALAESVFGEAQPLTVSGPIRLPQEGAVLPPLPPRTFPWQVDGVPGIHLLADAGLAAGLGPLRFGGGGFRVYSPTSTAWMAQNPGYGPLLAYTGSLRIPSAGLAMDVVAPTEPGSDELMLLGQFQGLSLDRLGQLADLAGTGDLLSLLPPQIQEVGDALGTLQLTAAGITVSPSRQTGVEVGWASFTVGMPDLRWQVWEDHFEVESIFCRFEVIAPFASLAASGAAGRRTQYEVTVYGRIQVQGVPVNVSASSRDGFTLYAELAEKQSIPLGELVQTYAPQLPAVGDLTVNTFAVAVAPSRYYSMVLAMASQPRPWVIEVGPGSLTVSDVVLSFTYPRGGPAAGSFGGTISFGSAATLTMRFDVPSASFMVRGSFPQVRLSDVVSTLVNEAVTLPGGFDLTFLESYVLIQKSGQSLVFRMGTELQGVGMFALEVRRTTLTANSWGVAAGLDLGGARLSSLPGLSGLAVLEDLFPLRKLVLVISTFEDPAFTFPDLAAFNAPQIAGGKLALPSGGGVIAGFNAHGEWAINPGDRAQKLLKELLRLDAVVGVTLQVGANPSELTRMYVSVEPDFDLNGYTGIKVAGQAGAQIESGSVGVFLNGSLTLPIQGNDQTFSVKLAVVANGAFLSATMRGTTPVDIRFDGVTVFQVGNLAVEVGINWEGIPTVGVAGTITSGAFASSIAVLIDSAEPQKSLVAGSLADLTLKDVVHAFTAGVAEIPAEVDEVLEQVAIRGTQRFQIPAAVGDDLDNLRLDAVAAAFAAQGVNIPTAAQQVFLAVSERDAEGKGTRWFLTDLKNRMRHYQLALDGDSIGVSVQAQIYCAPQRTTIGDLPPFEAGFYLNGAVEFLGFRAQATIDVSPSQGIAADGWMDPIVIGRMSDDFAVFSLTAAREDGTAVGGTGTALAAGNGGGSVHGPALSLSTFTQPNQSTPDLQAPHLVLNGQVQLLGIGRSVYARVAKSGVEFELKGDLSPAASYDLTGRVDGLTSLGAGGAVKVGLDTVDLGELGKVPINTGVTGNLDVGVNDTSAYAHLAAGFQFAGQALTLPRIDLDVRLAALRDLAVTVYDAVKNFLLDLLKDAAKWAEYVARGFIQGVQDVVQVLQDHFGKAKDEAERIVNGVVETTKKCATTTAAAVM